LPHTPNRSLSRRGRDRVEGPSSFYAMFTGQVESATFPNLDGLYVRYTFQHGPDWKIAQGIDAGFSQEAQKGGAGDASIVWNFPIDVTFKSTNPFGWPRLVLSVYSKVRRAGHTGGAAPPVGGRRAPQPPTPTPPPPLNPTPSLPTTPQTTRARRIFWAAT
jgi:hypothetical protein